MAVQIVRLKEGVDVVTHLEFVKNRGFDLTNNQYNINTKIT